jgi:hypothetical protein
MNLKKDEKIEIVLCDLDQLELFDMNNAQRHISSTDRVVHCVIKKVDDSYYMHCFDNERFQFGLSTNDRPDRKTALKTFIKLESIFKWSSKIGFQSVTLDMGNKLAWINDSLEVK